MLLEIAKCLCPELAEIEDWFTPSEFKYLITESSTSRYGPKKSQQSSTSSRGALPIFMSQEAKRRYYERCLSKRLVVERGFDTEKNWDPIHEVFEN